MTDLSILSTEAGSPAKEFFEDEVRDGFFVPSMMKRYWAAELRVLAEIDSVCKKHDIRWFADCGTLLGAVRHGGFVPWDDDLDICMLRHDYERFFEIAGEELPEEYCVLTIHTEEEYGYMLGRVVNARAIDYGKAHLEKNFGCPYTAGVDIFPLDGLSEDEEEEEKRRKKLQDISNAVELIRAGELRNPECRVLLADIERQNHTTLHRRGNLLRELLLLSETLYSAYPSEGAAHVALMPFWVSHHNHKYPIELFEKSVSVPFEYVDIQAPARYEEVLEIEYGNFMAVNKTGGIHDYPVYKEQEEMLKKKLGGNPYRYTMPGVHPEKRDVRSIRARCEEMISVIKQVHAQIRALCENGDHESAGQLMEGCQTLAISLGTLIEERIRGGLPAVHILEEYCELIYRISGDYRGDESVEALNNRIDEASKALGSVFDNKKREILFLPCKAAWWESMEPEWKKAVNDPSNDVYVTPLPYLIRDFISGEGERHDDGSLFPAYVKLTDISDYDIAKRHPDAVYIQNPYDGWNTVFSVSEDFFSEKLLQFTDELIYVPCFEAADPAEEADRNSVALRVLIEQPAVYFADKVILPTDRQKDVYLRVLTEYTGKGSLDYWDDKIGVSHAGQDRNVRSGQSRDRLPTGWQRMSANKKLLLYQVNAAYVNRYGLEGIRKLQDSLKLIKENADRIACVFSPHESLDQFPDDGGMIGNAWADFVERVKNDSAVIYDEAHEANTYFSCADGYYGSAGVIAHKSAEAGIPVMLMSQP